MPSDRLLAIGDVLAVRTADMSGNLAVADVLSLPEVSITARHNVTYFKVVHMSPKDATLVDASRTRIELKVIQPAKPCRFSRSMDVP